MQRLRAATAENNIYRWAGKILLTLLKIDASEPAESGDCGALGYRRGRSVALTSLISGHLTEVGAELRGAPHLLLGLDFDGTLVPIVSRPEDARIPEETRSIPKRWHRGRM